MRETLRFTKKNVTVSLRFIRLCLFFTLNFFDYFELPWSERLSRYIASFGGNMYARTFIFTAVRTIVCTNQKKSMKYLHYTLGQPADILQTKWLLKITAYGSKFRSRAIFDHTIQILPKTTPLWYILRCIVFHSFEIWII